MSPDSGPVGKSVLSWAAGVGGGKCVVQSGSDGGFSLWNNNNNNGGGGVRPVCRLTGAPEITANRRSSASVHAAPGIPPPSLPLACVWGFTSPASV